MSCNFTNKINGAHFYEDPLHSLNSGPALAKSLMSWRGYQLPRRALTHVGKALQTINMQSTLFQAGQCCLAVHFVIQASVAFPHLSRRCKVIAYTACFILRASSSWVVLIFSKSNKIFFGYFDPKNIFLDNKNGLFSGWPKRYFGWKKHHWFT